jgi:hypothetical protein
MNRDDRRPRAAYAQVSDARRARTLAGALAFLLLGTALYANNVQAQACGAQKDFIAGADPLPAPVRPADCSRVYQGAPDFTWPAVRGATHYTVVVTFPDGRQQTRTTSSNWLAWDQALAAGAYAWHVLAAGAKPAASQPRTFVVDASAGAAMPARAADIQHAAASPSTYPRDSHGISTLPVTAPATGRENADPASRGAVPTVTAWTSPGVAMALTQ